MSRRPGIAGWKPLLLAALLVPVLAVNGACDFGRGQPAVPSKPPTRYLDNPLANKSLVEQAETEVEPYVEERAALQLLNEARGRAGLAPLGSVDESSAAAQNHADYLWLNPAGSGLSAHVEEEGRAGFTGRTLAARLSSAGLSLVDTPPLAEVVAWHPRSTSAMAHWLESAYHRLALLSPAATAAGYGHVTLDGRSVNVMDLVRDAAGDGSRPVVVFPAPGDTGVPASWDGIETPAPPAPAGGFPSGPIISVASRPGVALAITEHTLRSEAGEPIAHMLVTGDDDGVLAGWSAALLYADEPLLPGATYEVHVEGTVDGEPFSKTWSFETARGRDDCRPGFDTCGPGRACYGLAAPFRCRFEGILPEGAPCETLNACEPGTTCSNGRCQAFCSSGGALHGGLSGTTPDCVPTF